MKRIILSGILFFLFSMHLGAAQHYRILQFDGMERKYLIEHPKKMQSDSLLPAILAFHGGGGNAIQLKNFWKLHHKALPEHFMVIYPEAVDGYWRIAPHNGEIDDVGFIRALADSLIRRYSIDPNRLYATGVSNGGMFCFRLALSSPELLKGIAIMAANLPASLEGSEIPKPGIPLLMINGTDDPIMPYEGGLIRVNLFPKLNKLLHRSPKPRGNVLSVDETISWWLKSWPVELVNDSLMLPDKKPDDGCTVLNRTWKTSEGITLISQYRIDGGGHSIPNMKQSLPKSIIGNSCKDFDARPVILDFFKQF